MDYPFYEELCRRKHWARWWWLLGDRLYYLGLLPALLSLPAVGLALGAGLIGRGWHWLVAAGVIFTVGVMVFALGAFLKEYSHRMATRDGIEDKW
jgi:hypothetical protein